MLPCMGFWGGTDDISVCGSSGLKKECLLWSSESLEAFVCLPHSVFCAHFVHAFLKHAFFGTSGGKGSLGISWVEEKELKLFKAQLRGRRRKEGKEEAGGRLLPFLPPPPLPGSTYSQIYGRTYFPKTALSKFAWDGCIGLGAVYALLCYLDFSLLHTFWTEDNGLDNDGNRRGDFFFFLSCFVFCGLGNFLELLLVALLLPASSTYISCDFTCTLKRVERQGRTRTKPSSLPISLSQFSVVCLSLAYVYSSLPVSCLQHACHGHSLLLSSFSPMCHSLGSWLLLHSLTNFLLSCRLFNSFFFLTLWHLSQS